MIAVDKESKKDILMIIGPYGPYLQLGMQEEGEKLKPKRITFQSSCSVKILFKYVLKLISLPKDLGVHPDTGKKIIANIGRFGPYVKFGDEFKSIPKTENIFEIKNKNELFIKTFEKNIEVFDTPSFDFIDLVFIYKLSRYRNTISPVIIMKCFKEFMEHAGHQKKN